MKIITSSPSFSAPRPATDTARQPGTTASQDPTRLLLGKLAEQIPGMTAKELATLEAEQFTPAKVAGRISDFVAAGLDAARARGASDERLQQMYEAAVQGVQQGFREARDILDQLDLLNGRIAEQVDETEQLTFEALGQIAPGSREAQAQAVLGAAERYRNAEEMSLTVTTRDGDQVTIQFSRHQDQQSRLGAGADSDGNAFAWLDVSRSESSQYRFSVQGELDEGEIEALQQMVRDIAGVADEFFNGDVQRAFEQSAEIRFDAGELQSMQLDMSYRRSWTRASAYEQVGRLEQPVDKPGLRLGQLMKELAGSVGAPSLGFLQSPAQAGRALMSGLVEQDSRLREAMTDLQTQLRQNLQRLLDIVFPPPETADTAAPAADPEPVTSPPPAE